MKQTIEQLDELQKKLYNSVVVYRLNKDLYYIEQELKNNEINEEDPQNIITKAKNTIKKQNTDNLTVKRKDALDRLNTYQSNHTDLFTEEELPSKISELLKGNDAYMLLDLFSITFVNDKSISYNQPGKTLEDVSILIYEDKNKLKSIQDEFKKVYKDITGTGLSLVQKGGLIGTAILSIIGLSPAGLLSFVKIGALVGGVYAGMKFYNVQQVREDMKKLDYEQIAYLLALKYILFNNAKQHMNEDEMKEYLNELLSLTSDLKADSLYFLLVEKEGIERNKLLTDAYYRFDKKLIKSILPETNKSIL